jgi:hypothetical protein
LFYPVAGDRFLELTLVCGNLLVGSARISFTCEHRVYLKLPPKMFSKEKLITCYYFMYLNVLHDNV